MTDMNTVTHDRFWDFVNARNLTRMPVINKNQRGNVYLDDQNIVQAEMKQSRQKIYDVPTYKIMEN